MSINVNQDYSQFYVGTEQLKSYGSNSAAKKDTLVKYRFNTTDEHGNKIMDKMSREETLQAMRDIRSQYGDDAIVEFSGDGMAALVESKKSGSGVDLDKIMARTPEQRAVPEDMVTQLEGTYRIVSADDEINKHISWHDTLKEKAPDVCDELDDLMQNVLDHALNHSGDGEKFGAKFVELVKKAEKAISAYDVKKESVVDETGKKATAGETHRIVGNGATGLVSFYGASMTQEQSEKLQGIIKDLEGQGNSGLGDSWNVGAYAELGMKVSQLSYACKEMGLSDDAAAQVTKTYGQQAEEKMNKYNDMLSSLQEKVREEREKFYKEHGTPHYRKGAAEIKESLVHKSSSGKSGVELNIEANRDIYQMFSNLDTSSKEAFADSFEKAVAGFKNYLAGGDVPIFTGTGAQQTQLEELAKRFQSFLGA